jgi:YVTN family beta-propeller protein
VSVIDTASNTAVATIPVGGNPEAVAFTPDGATAYVVNGIDDTASVIDTATNTVTDTIPAGTAPIGVAFTPDQAPVARLALTPAPAGQPTTFDASASTVMFGQIATYAWDFGDGTTATTTTPTTTHAYAAPGNYPVTLTLTSTGGTSTTDVFTGKTMSRNGGPQAVTTATATIAAAPTPSPTTPAPGGGGAAPGGGLPVTGPAAATTIGAGLVATLAGAVLIGLSVRRRRTALTENVRRSDGGLGPTRRSL